MQRNEIDKSGADLPGEEFWKEYLVPSLSGRGCALLGKTKFDKLDVIKKFLIDQKFNEFAEFNEFDQNEEPHGYFIVEDCRRLDADSVMKLAHEYRHVPCVILTHCEGILQQDDVLRVFAHLLDKNDYDSPFPTKSFYVFVGEENTIPRKADYAPDSAIADHIGSFCTYVHCYDFDAGNPYLG